ncbi:hypothetical protein RvY_16736-1 [Ramazzottius varieornatus]|uniref:Probable arginine--tRNA ligase, mitochondrial n=1 Tax=Ramazzottius varieornatus TaxID=947166 RepID=A0A1D1VZK8_RAMVA|nr:hypothetical protein RvY_16736-1 [Ramazzottius varieornatus]
MAEYLKVYKRLGITFDEITGESKFVKAAKEVSTRIEAERPSDSLLKETALVDKRLLKSDGSSLYLSRDLAAILEHARQLDFDEKLYVVDNSQHDHFQYLFKLARDFDEIEDRDFRHIKFGRIRGLSTRQGKVQLLSEILDKAETSMIERIKRSKYARPRPEEMDDVAKTLALTVIFINDFKQKRQMDYSDPFLTLQQSEGDSGVFLQYNHARLCSVEKNSGVKLNPDVALDYLNEEEALALISHLSLAPATAQTAMEDFEPVVIVKYLFLNAHLTSKALKSLRVKDRAPEVAEGRLFLFHCSRIVARSFLKLLGIQPLDAM